MLIEQENIDKVERETVERLRVTLGDYLMVSNRVCDIVAEAIAGTPDATFKDVLPSRRVAMNLFRVPFR